MDISNLKRIQNKKSIVHIYVHFANDSTLKKSLSKLMKKHILMIWLVAVILNTFFSIYITAQIHGIRMLLQ